MLLPIGDSPNFRSTPWVTYGLIALNVLVFVATLPLTLQPADPDDPAAQAYAEILAREQGARVQWMSAYDALVFRYGFKPRFPAVRDMLTSMFLHGGLLHLLGNMLFLWIYGDNVEHRLGRMGFLAAYLLTGVAAALGDGLLRPGSAVPAVGASGAISGVLGLYFVWFPRNRVRVWVFLFPLLMDVIEVPARLVLAMYVVVDNLLPMLVSGGGGAGIAYGAHLGGFIAGLALAFGADRLWLRRPEPAVRRGSSRRGGGEVAGAVLRSRLNDGDLSGALSAYLHLGGRESRTVQPEPVLELAGRLEADGHLRAALAVLQRLASDRRGDAAAAHARLAIGRLLRRLEMPVEAYQVLVRALDDGPPADVRAAITDELEALGRRGVMPRRASARERG